MGPAEKPTVRVVGRYALHGVIAAGGMATVHFGRLLGPVGFSRTVAIKRLHAQFSSDPEFVSMFLDEARIVARIRHPNVIPTLDVVANSGELFLVMEYVPGESLARLARVIRERNERIPERIISAIIAGTLHGLHAAHEAKDERGVPLAIVHRDVSPQNVLVGIDGVSRVIDFGVAKAAGRSQTTREGQIKGKLSYMPPEQLSGHQVTRQADIYSASVMLWELVTGKRLFSGDNEGVIIARVLEGNVVPPSRMNAQLKQTLTNTAWHALDQFDALVMKGLSKDPTQRFATAREMAIALERAIPPATASEVGEWVEHYASDILSYRAERVAEIESSASMVASPEKLMDALNAHNTRASQYPTRTQMGAATAADGAGGPTQTRVSVVGPAQPPPGSRSRGALAAVLAIALIAGLLVGAFVIRAVRATPTKAVAAAPEATATATTPTASTESVVPAEPTATATTVATATTPSATPTATTPTAATVAAAPKGKSPSAPHRPTSAPAPSPSPAAQPTAAPTSTTPADCNPPYTWGPDGIKVYKKHCPLN